MLCFWYYLYLSIKTFKNGLWPFLIPAPSPAPPGQSLSSVLLILTVSENRKTETVHHKGAWGLFVNNRALNQCTGAHSKQGTRVGQAYSKLPPDPWLLKPEHRTTFSQGPFRLSGLCWCHPALLPPVSSQHLPGISHAWNPFNHYWKKFQEEEGNVSSIPPKSCWIKQTVSLHHHKLLHKWDGENINKLISLILLLSVENSA